MLILPREQLEAAMAQLDHAIDHLDAPEHPSPYGLGVREIAVMMARVNWMGRRADA